MLEYYFLEQVVQEMEERANMVEESAEMMDEKAEMVEKGTEIMEKSANMVEESAEVVENVHYTPARLGIVLFLSSLLFYTPKCVIFHHEKIHYDIRL